MSFTKKHASSQQSNSTKNTPSVYAAAQRAQTWHRLRRWLPLDESANIPEIPQIYTDLATRLHSVHRWAEVLTQLKAWLLAQPERWLRLLTALRPGQPLRRMSLSQLVALALSAGLTAGVVSQPLVALAQGPEPVGDEFHVNNYTTSEQRAADIALDQDGDFVIVWHSTLQDGNGYGIFAQRYNASGTPQGNEFQVNTFTTNSQEYPSVAMDADGDFVIAWTSNDFSDLGQDGDDEGIFAQRYNASGTPQGNEFQVNTFTTNRQQDPSVAMDADGDFVIAWTSYNQDGNGAGIFAQRYNASGTPQGSEFQVNTFTASPQRNPSVAMDAEGDFIVVWADNIQDGNFYGVFAQRYNASGTPQGSEFQVNTFTTNSQFDPSVAMDAEGDFIVVWQSYAQDGSQDGIFAQRYNVSGTPQGSEFQVNSYTTAFQSDANVAMDAEGNFVVIWESPGNQDGNGFGIFAQRYNASGTPQKEEFQVNTFTTSGQFDPSIAMDAEGDFVATWTSYNQDDNLGGIFAQRYGTIEIDIRGKGRTIPDNDTTPSTSDNTDFGQALLISDGIELAFTIINTGTAELNLTSSPPVTISGMHVSDFEVTEQPSTTIAANSNTSFTIKFTPSAIGIRTAEVSLSNNDADENPYNFTIQGTGVDTLSVYLPLIIKP